MGTYKHITSVLKSNVYKSEDSFVGAPLYWCVFELACLSHNSYTNNLRMLLLINHHYLSQCLRCGVGVAFFMSRRHQAAICQVENYLYNVIYVWFQ